VFDPHKDSRGQRVFLLLAFALLLLQAAFLFGAPSFSATSLIANVIEFFCSALAAAACFSAACRSQYFAKHFWLLFAAGCAIWSVAQLMATYYDSILHRPLQQPWPSDVIFFLAMAPPAMTLFIDKERGFDLEQWPLTFDLLQVIILTVAAYLFTFDTPASWRSGWGDLALISWIPDTARDMLLLVAFVVAAGWGKFKAAGALYGRMSIFFLAYLAGEIPYLYLQAKGELHTGTPWELCWSVPFVVATVLAVSAGAAPGTPLQLDRPEKNTGRVGRWGLVHFASLLFPLVVLLMAAGIAEKQLLLAITLVLISFACSVARILFSEHQQLQAARALEENNALLNSVFEGTGDALFVKDLQGRYVIVNETYAEMMKLTRKQIIGKSVAELLDVEDALRVAKQDKEVLDSGKLQTFESTSTIGGQQRVLTATKAPWRDRSGQIVGLLGVLRDITEYRHMEGRLRQSQKMEAIGTLAGGVAHDFNNLLMVINGYSSILADALNPGSKLRGHVEQVQKAGERAASLTRQLLAFSRKQTVQATTLNFNHVLTGMEKLLHRLLGENILISANLAPDLGLVLADAGQLEQVILNLAINARDAMPEGGHLSFETRNVELSEALASANNLKPGQYVEFVVKDTGVGMSMDVQTRVFEPFFTTKSAGKGTGLGLSTVYGILKQANGHISFTSQPGHGTSFLIFLPRTDLPQPASSPSAEMSTALQGRETVLLVEDDTSVSDLIRAVLGSHGYNVLTPLQPQKAEELFDAHAGQVDLLLSDLVMPEVSGTELAKRLSTRNPRMKVLFMSGYVGDPVVRQGIQGHEIGFLQKPFAPLTLVRKVRDVLDGSRVSDQ
jgi:PAS domain S-box-containing protein